MKKLFVALAFTILSFTAFSQVRVRPGIRLGTNISKITNSFNEDNKTGLYAAIFLNVRFVDFYALQPEVYYSNQGGKASMTGVEDLKINYVGVAIANQFFVAENLGLHFIVGPSIDFNFDDYETKQVFYNSRIQKAFFLLQIHFQYCNLSLFLLVFSI